MKFLNNIDGADKVVTSDAQQFISKAEKEKLTGIQAGALNNPHPATHPYSMITGTPTSLPANGGNALSASHLLGDDTRAVNSDPSVYMSSGSRWAGRAGWQTEFKNRTAINSPPLSGTYVYLQTHTPWSDPSGGYPIQIAYGSGIPCWRVGTSTTTWSVWQKVSDGGNADTVNGFTVGVNVPANAKFTDTNTITTINGKTGAIAKADIVALGIPSSDTNTTYTAGTGLTLAGTVFTPDFGTGVGKVVQGNDARLSDARTASGGNADTVSGFTVGISVPANAKFTDTNTTYSEISEAEINTGTASTLRTMTARRITFIINKIMGVVSGELNNKVDKGQPFTWGNLKNGL